MDLTIRKMKCVKSFIGHSHLNKHVLSLMSFEVSLAFCLSFVNRLALVDRDCPCMNL